MTDEMKPTTPMVATKDHPSRMPNGADVEKMLGDGGGATSASVSEHSANDNGDDPPAGPGGPSARPPVPDNDNLLVARELRKVAAAMTALLPLFQGFFDGNRKAIESIVPRLVELQKTNDRIADAASNPRKRTVWDFIVLCARLFKWVVVPAGLALTSFMLGTKHPDALPRWLNSINAFLP